MEAVDSWRAVVLLVLMIVLTSVASTHAQTPQPKWRASGLSDRDLLRVGQPASRTQTPKTLRILAIRAEFQEDDNPLTTGIGKFDLSDTSRAIIDPPPHDLSYFEQQLLALRNYYKSVSQGQLLLDFEVFPQSPTGSYTVAHGMSHYVPLGSETALDQRLSEFFQEAFHLADEADDIDFSQFDSFIVFHAGVGADFAFDFDPTPQDLPSVFLDFDMLRTYLADGDPEYQGIPVNDGAHFIRDGIILPEGQSQEDFEIALLGTAALMFGHQLGLPNLFNTETGRPGIGVFGLMDQGSGNLFGILPAEPSAWSKVFLGWEEPVVVTRGEALPVGASRANHPSRIYKIPINSQEYFLLENRQRDVNGDGLAVGRDATGEKIAEFFVDEFGQLRGRFVQPGVVTQVDEYDFGLPGSGILIWHVDEAVIRATLADNRVNADPERRGVDLEEADGAQDIGQVYGFLHPAAGQENGTRFDMFWGSNKINMRVNDSARVVAFTPDSRPNSRSNDGANAGIYVTEFSEPDTVMRFSVRAGFLQPGFPQFTGAADGLSTSPVVADLDGDGHLEIIQSADAGTDLYAWKSDGSKLIANEDSVTIEAINGEVEKRPLAVFAQPPGVSSRSPAVARLNQESLVVAVTDAAVAAYRAEDRDADGRADSLFVVQTGESVSTDPLVVQEAADAFTIVAGTEAGSLVIVDSEGQRTLLANVGAGPIAGLGLLGEPANGRVAFTTADGLIGALSVTGERLWTFETGGAISRSPVVGDLNNDGELDLMTLTDDGQLFVLDAVGILHSGFPRATQAAASSALAVADIDADGFMEVITQSGEEIFSFNHAGALETGFPIALQRSAGSASGVLTAAPILVDLTGDDRPEILVGAQGGRVEAFSLQGKAVQGFPLSTGGTVNATATAADLDTDGDLEVVIAAEDGFLYVWDLPVAYDPEGIPWGAYLADVQHTNANLRRPTPVQPAASLMPKRLVYNYPNPTQGDFTTIRYTLNFPAEVSIKIFDLAGDFVDELQGTGFPQAENEVVWPLDDIQSGVYLARVQAQGTGAAAGLLERTIIKIAVVK